VHHVHAQAEKYREASEAEQAWVVNFATVPPTNFPAGQYPFGESDKVSVMHVHLHADLTRADIYLKDKPKIGPIAIQQPLRGTSLRSQPSF
jgi:hypothetical protein